MAWDLIFLQLFSLFFRVRVFVPFFCVSLFLKKSLLFLKDKELMLKFLVEDEEVAAVLKAKRLRLYKHNRRIAWFRPTANSRTPTTFGNATRQKMLVSCWAGKRIGHLFIGSTWEKPKTTKNSKIVRILNDKSLEQCRFDLPALWRIYLQKTFRIKRSQ